MVPLSPKSPQMTKRSPLRPRRAVKPRPVVETLEDRTLLAASFVDINPNNSNLGNPNGASGGRFNGLASVAGNNQVFYGASEWGGLYKSVDGGNTWAHLDGHLPTVTWDVEVTPTNVNRVFATSFYDGAVSSLAGLQVSNEDGATWVNPSSAHVNPGGLDNTPQTNHTATATQLQEMSGFGIGIRPDAPNNVYIGTSVGLARSTDGGVTWTFVDPSIPTPGGAAPGATATTVFDVVVQAGGANGIIDVITSRGHFGSTDGGNNWSANTLPAAAFNQGATLRPRLSLAVSPDEAYVLYVAGNDLNIWASTDAGATAGNWRNLGTPDPTPQGRIAFLTTNQRADQGGNNIFDLWFGDVRLYRGRGTTPAMPAVGGASRMQAVGGFAGDFSTPAGAHNDLGDIVFDTQAANDASPRIVSTDGGVYRNTNNNADTPAWTQPNVTPHATWLFGMAGVQRAGANQEDLYFSLQDDGFWATQTAGAAAVAWNNTESADSFEVVADATQIIYDNGFFSPGRGFRLSIANPGGGGEVQFNDPNDYPDATGIAAPFQYIDDIAQFGPSSYVLVNGIGVFFTTNLTIANVTGNTVAWTQLGAATTPANALGIKVAMNGGTPTFFLLAGNRSSDNGNQLWTFTGTGAGNWTQIDNQGGQTGGVGIFAVDPNNPNRIYASNFAAGGLRMVSSTDGGTTWNPDTRLDTMMTGPGPSATKPSRGCPSGPAAPSPSSAGTPSRPSSPSTRTTATTSSPAGTTPASS